MPKLKIAAVASEHEVGFTTDFVRVLPDSSMRSARQLLSGSSSRYRLPVPSGAHENGNQEREH
jgi:hypothetical protein